MTENELVLIDSGPIPSKRLMELLDERHWRVRAVIHTHVHIDHVANDLLLLEKFPDILFIHQRMKPMRLHRLKI